MRKFKVFFYCFVVDCPSREKMVVEATNFDDAIAKVEAMYNCDIEIDDVVELVMKRLNIKQK